MKKASFLDKFIYFFNSIFATLLLLSYLLPYVSPKSFPVFTILSLFVPLLILINILFAVFWLIRLKRKILLSLIILILGYFISTPYFKFFDTNNAKNDDLRVMSYNVRMFNFFSWNEDKTIENKIQDFIIEKNPDILAVQEYHQSTKIEAFYPYKFIKKKKSTSQFGVALFSKYKIVNSGSLDFDETTNNGIFIDIERNNETIRIYSLHMQSLSIDPDKDAIINENKEKLFKRVGNSFKKQGFQAEKIIENQQNYTGKKIICGDFNNTAYSWVYKKLAENKKDAFLEAGKGFGKTFNYPFPVRIDFILADKNSEINQFTTYSVDYSDHFPILARINWKN
jgi:vancomycin resistance protein VanJ